MKCSKCTKNSPFIKRPFQGTAQCSKCFIESFEEEVNDFVKKTNMFDKGDRVIIGVSGGKDSTTLLHVMNVLNQKYQYGIEIIPVCIDEGISPYRDYSLKILFEFLNYEKLKLNIYSFKDLYGWSLDEIANKLGKKGSSMCTYCGIFRRKALDYAALKFKANKIATGHNADDTAETLLMNLMRGDMKRIGNSTKPIIGEKNEILKVKPLLYHYEKEIVMYCIQNKLKYCSSECTYAENSFRAEVRDFVKSLLSDNPSSIISSIHSGNFIKMNEKKEEKIKHECIICHMITSHEKCKACLLVESLNKLN